MREPTDWQQLMNMTRGQAIAIERVRIVDKDVFIEGSFELPLLAQLSPEDQLFVATFVKCHGSIKEMERICEVSYPTIKAALNRITKTLEMTTTPPVSQEAQESERALSQSKILKKLQDGEIRAEDAVRELETLE